MQRPHDEPSNFHSLFALTTQCCWYYWFCFFVLPLFTWLFLCNLSSRLGGSYRTNISKCVALLLNVYMPSVLLLLFAVGKWAACSNPRRHALPSYLRHQIGPRKRKIKRPIQWWGHHQSYPHHKPVRYLSISSKCIFFSIFCSFIHILTHPLAVSLWQLVSISSPPVAAAFATGSYFASQLHTAEHTHIRTYGTQERRELVHAGLRLVRIHFMFDTKTWNALYKKAIFLLFTLFPGASPLTEDDANRRTVALRCDGIPFAAVAAFTVMIFVI